MCSRPCPTFARRKVLRWVRGFARSAGPGFWTGKRPDVEHAYPTLPRNSRAGWGYLLLTSMLPNQGNGNFRIHAIADDAEGHSIELGARTIVCVAPRQRRQARRARPQFLAARSRPSRRRPTEASDGTCLELSGRGAHRALAKKGKQHDLALVLSSLHRLRARVGSSWLRQRDPAG